MSKPTINGCEMLAAIPVYNRANAKIVRWYVVLDRGSEYVTLGLPRLDHEGEWAGSGRYTTSLGNAIQNALSVAEQWTREVNGE